MDDLRLAPVPPPPGPRDQVKRIEGGEEATFCILSKTYWGIWTHWTDGRSMPCKADKSQCPGCRNEMPTRWKGYLHVFDVSSKKDCFLELTPLTAQLLDQQAPKGEDFRGLHFTISRGRGNKARLRLTMQIGRVAENQLPPAKDPAPVLISLWSMPDRKRAPYQDPQSRFSAIDRGHEQSYN